MTLPSGLSMTADLNVAPLLSSATKARRALGDVVDYAKKNATLELTAKLAGNSINAIQEQIDKVGTGRNLKFSITLDPASVTTAASTLEHALRGVAGLNLSTVTTVQAQIATQITKMTALIAELRALGSSGGAGGGNRASGPAYSVNTQTLLSDLEALNNEYKRGDVAANAYAVRLAGLQSALRVASAGATAGSAEFKALDRAVTQTVQGLRNVETANITKLRTDLAGARAQFDAAAAAATNLGERRAAIAAYEGDLTRIRVALQGMATSGRLTDQQLKAVNLTLAQTARESNSIHGGVNIAGLSGNLSNALQNLTSYIPGVSQLTGVIGNVPPALLGVVGGLSLLTAGMAASFKTAAEFQQKMADISALTGKVGPELSTMSNYAKDFGVPLGIGARDAADAMLSLSKAGLSAEEIMGGGLAAALNLAAAAGIDTAKAGDLAVTAMTAFGMQAKELPQIANIYAGFANQTTLGADDLGQALAAVGPVAQAAGLNLAQMSGYMATLAKGGFKNMSDAGTSLKTMLLSLQSPSTTAGNAMREIGLNAYDAEGNFRPLGDTLEDLRKKLNGMSEQGRNNVLKNMFGSDGIRAAQILYQATGKKIADVTGKIVEQGDAAGVAKSRMNTYQGEVSKMQANFEALRIEIGEKLLPAATGFVKFLNEGVSGIRNLANGTENLLGCVIPLATGMVALSAPMVLSGLAAVVGWLNKAKVAMLAFAEATPIAAVGLAALAALAIKVNQLYGEIAKTYEQIDQQDAKTNDNVQARISELNKKSDSLSRAQARYLALTVQLQEAQKGTYTGTNMWGERQYAIDPEAVKKAQEALAGARKELAALQLQAGKTPANAQTTADATGIDPDKVATQTKALEDLREAISGRMDAMDADVPPKLSTKIAQIGKAYAKLIKDLGKAYGGNTNNTEYLKGVAEAEAAKQKEISTARRKWATDENKKRKEEEDKASEAVVSAQLDGEKARIDAMEEGAAKRQALRQNEIQQAEADTKKSLIGVKSADARADLVEAGRLKVATINAKWDAADRKAEEDAAKQAADISRQALFTQQANEISLMTEGRAKRQAQLGLDIAQAQAETQKAVEEAKGKPQVIAALELAGLEKIHNLRETARQDEEKAAQDHARKLLQYAAEALQNQENLAAAQRATELAQFDLNSARQLEALKGNAVAQAQLEQELARKRAALLDQQATASEDAQRRQLANSRDQALSADGLTAVDRRHIWNNYYSAINTLDAKSHTDAITRLADREAKEREAAEKIRAARVAAAEKPITKGQTGIEELEFQKGLAKTAAERLALETQLGQAHARQEALIRGVLARSKELNLTEQEKTDLNKQLTTEQRAQQTIAAGMPALQKEVTQELREQQKTLRDLNSRYGDLGLMLAPDTGITRAQNDLTHSTTELGFAYRDLLPWMEKVRTGSLKKDDYDQATSALTTFLGALDDQKQKLAALRGEYDKQKAAIKDIQGLISEVGSESGNTDLLKGVVDSNQQAYQAAFQALQDLKNSGTTDITKLAAGAKELQDAYGGLKDSVKSLGEAQAKVFEDQADKLKSAADKQTAALDMQIKNAKAAGLDTTALEQQKEQITSQLEARVKGLEEKAAKARTDATNSIKSITEGLAVRLHSEGLSGLMNDMGKAAAKAQTDVNAMGKQIKTTEADVDKSAAKMKASLSGAFKGLPDLAGKAGKDAGVQFVKELQAKLKAPQIPKITVGVGAIAGASSKPAAASIVQNFVINGQQVSGGSLSPNIKTLLKQLANEADAECRRRNS